jgi:hypothetical protein
MPNLYATLAEVRSIAPDALQSSVTTYDQLFLRLANTISRWIDDHCQRVFYPLVETRYFEGRGGEDLYIEDLLSASEVAYSTDGGLTYTVLSSSDYILMAGEDYNPRGSYNQIKVDINGDLGSWPKGQKAVRVIGLWSWTDNREEAWLDSTDEVEDNPLASSDATLTVNDVDGADLFGATPRLSAGNLIRIEDEYCEATATASGSNTATIVRGRNGSDADAHAQNTQIDIWRVPDVVKQGTIIQAIHQFKRGQAGYADAEALPDVGRIMHIKTIDPEVIELLASVRKLGAG